MPIFCDVVLPVPLDRAFTYKLKDDDHPPVGQTDSTGGNKLRHLAVRVMSTKISILSDVRSAKPTS